MHLPLLHHLEGVGLRPHRAQQDATGRHRLLQPTTPDGHGILWNKLRPIKTCENERKAMTTNPICICSHSCASRLNAATCTKHIGFDTSYVAHNGKRRNRSMALLPMWYMHLCWCNSGVYQIVTNRVYDQPEYATQETDGRGGAYILLSLWSSWSIIIIIVIIISQLHQQFCEPRQQ